MDAIVLLGPPGSGKTHVGRMLNAEGVADYVELEPILVERFGEGSAFRANKAQALAFISEHFRDRIRESDRLVVFESTGWSDHPMLEELASEADLRFVHMSTPKEVCVRRVSERAKGQNISNDPVAADSFYKFWYDEVRPRYQFALTVTGEDDVTALREIARLTSGE